MRSALVAVSLVMVAAVHAQRLPPPSNANYIAIQRILESPEQGIDLARAKLAIDRMIDPSIEVESTLTQLDKMAQEIKAMLPANASSRLTLDALRYHIYQPTAWNQGRPFQYDLDDPYGRNVRNKLMPTYLATRKGNCVSMPLLFIILGQKLGLDVTASLAPNHVFVQWRDTDGKLYNLETTSGAGFTRDLWMRQQFSMTDEALKSGIYMRPLSKKETVAVMAGTLLEFYGQQGRQEPLRALAVLLQQYSPRDVSFMLHQHAALLGIRHQEFVRRYPTPRDIPEDKRARFIELESQVKALYDRAFALGWRPLDESAEARYKNTIITTKEKNQGGMK